MKKNYSVIPFLALLAGFLLFIGFKNSSESPVENTGLQVGQTAPDFNLKNIDGSMVSLASVNKSYSGKLEGYIVIFTCNTCPWAVMYEDRIIELHNTYAPKGWPVIAIQPNDVELKPGDSFEEMKVRAKDKGFPFAYLLDDKQEVFPAYGATRTPHVYLLDKSKKIRYIGAIDNNPQDADAASEKYVESAITSVVAGKSPQPDFTKAVGCTIKSKK